MGKINIDKANGFTPVRTDSRSEVKRPTGSPAAVPNSKESGDDRLDLSARASEVGTLVEKLKEMPDIRHEKVSALRASIAEGRYNPSSDEIADAILKDAKSER